MPISILYTIAYFHSLEIILRAETVEQAHAGDKCDFSGTLIVVPDVSKLQMPGKFEVVHKEISSCFGMSYRISEYISV